MARPKLKLAPLPRSRAKTAYGLLKEIERIIVEEPKRYDQSDYLRTVKESWELYGTTIETKKDLKERGFPECGTVGCVAGWVYTLKGSKVRTSRRGRLLTRGGLFDHASLEGRARRILGLSAYQAMRLFSADLLSEWEDEEGNRRVSLKSTPAVGTLAYAKAGAKAIAKFREENAKQLKAKRV